MIRKNFFVTNIALAALIALGVLPARAAAQGFNTKPGAPTRVSSGISLAAKKVRSSGTRPTGSTLRGARSNALPKQAAPAPTRKPKPELDALRGRLKKKEPIVVKPLPPTPKLKRKQGL